jgi:hypothetical protein
MGGDPLFSGPGYESLHKDGMLINKLTGMLLEMDESDIRTWFADTDACDEKIREAMVVLEQASWTPPPGLASVLPSYGDPLLLPRVRSSLTRTLSCLVGVVYCRL